MTQTQTIDTTPSILALKPPKRPGASHRRHPIPHYKLSRYLARRARVKKTLEGDSRVRRGVLPQDHRTSRMSLEEDRQVVHSASNDHDARLGRGVLEEVSRVGAVGVEERLSPSTRCGQACRKLSLLVTVSSLYCSLGLALVTSVTIVTMTIAILWSLCTAISDVASATGHVVYYYCCPYYS